MYNSAVDFSGDMDAADTVNSNVSANKETPGTVEAAFTTDSANYGKSSANVRAIVGIIDGNADRVGDIATAGPTDGLQYGRNDSVLRASIDDDSKDVVDGVDSVDGVDGVQLSFAEIAEMIRHGQQIPGTKTVADLENIEPPSLSINEPLAKPWMNRNDKTRE